MIKQLFRMQNLVRQLQSAEPWNTPMQALQPIFAAVLFTILLASPLLAQGQRATGSGISTPNSPHNFTDNRDSRVHGNEIGLGGWNGSEEICRVCHVPHDHDRATRYGDRGLLWNHAVSSATYTMYASSTLDGSMASQPTGYSKMCLGCHDGTVAVDTFDKYAGGSVYMDDFGPWYLIPGANNYAGDLGKTHPISMVYDPLLDPNLMAKTDPMGGSGTIDDVLENGVMQCSSCHDVHDQPGESVPGTALLRVNQKGSKGTPSGLCLTCHIK